jgi:hypothetical protein
MEKGAEGGGVGGLEIRAGRADGRRGEVGRDRGGVWRVAWVR